MPGVTWESREELGTIQVLVSVLSANLPQNDSIQEWPQWLAS